MANYIYNSFEDLTTNYVTGSNAAEDKQLGPSEGSIHQKYIYDTPTTSLLQIKNYSDIRNKIIPFFNKYPILG